jgi:small subunit ribosomal protein S20
MANHKSAIKRHRQSIVKRDRNRTTKATVRAAIKAARAAITAKAPNAKELVVTAEKLLASAAKKGTFHRKNAARRTSRLASALTTTK